MKTEDKVRMLNEINECLEQALKLRNEAWNKAPELRTTEVYDSLDKAADYLESALHRMQQTFTKEEKC